MLSPSSSGTIHPPRDRINGHSQAYDAGHSRPGLEPSTSTLSSSRSRVFDRLRPWKSTSVAGRRKSTLFNSNSKKENDLVAGDPYVEQAVASTSTPNSGPSASPRRSEDADGDGYEWEEGSEDGGESVTYSWVDPSVVGTSALGHSPIPEEGEEPRSPGAASSLLRGPITPVATRDPPHVSLHRCDLSKR